MAKKKVQNSLEIDKMIANEAVINSDIVNEIQHSMMTYALKTIEDRALPDAKDGLKPVQRRILYAAWENKYLPNTKMPKNAKIVAATMGDYHPHGDTSIYSALVNMSQSWNYRYPLIDFQGNNGSIDGDSPAAMRYTEGRLDKNAIQLLNDLEKESVIFKTNYSETTQEPIILPGLFPNFLLNGSSGIAVGYTTDMPSHQLGEVVDGIIHVINNPNCTISEINNYIQAPDFAGGACLIKNNKISELYETGKASLTFKAKYKIELNEETENTQIAFYELPPDVDKPKLVEKIYNLCLEEKKIPRVIDVRDESDGYEIRIVVELHKTAVPNVIINELYDKTHLKKNKTFLMRALINQAPKLLNLKEIIEYYLEHRRDVVYKRTQYILTKAKNKLHIQEGLKIAVDNVDKIIEIIKNSNTDDDAKRSLKNEFILTNEQIEEIMEIKLRRLTKMNKQDIENLIKKLKTEIEACGLIVSNVEEINKVIISELKNLKKEFNDMRRTQLLDEIESENIMLSGTTENEEFKSDEPIMLVLTSKNTIKHLTINAFEDMFRRNSLKEKNELFIQGLKCKLDDNFVLILKDGTYIKVDFSDLLTGLEKFDIKSTIKAIITYSDLNKSVLILTKRGIVKKTNVIDLKRNKKISPLLILQPNDEIIGVKIIDNTIENIITIATREGLIHRFFEKSFKETNPGGLGIGGMTLNINDEIVDFEISDKNKDENNKLVIFTQHSDDTSGIKSLKLNEFKPKGRMAQGLFGITYDKKNPGIIKKILIINEDTFVLDKKSSINKISFIKLPEYNRYNKPDLYKSEIDITRFFLE